MSICSAMRSTALLSAGLFGGGLLLLTLVETTGAALPIAHAALLLMLAAALTLAVALVLALWPGNARQRAQCRH